MELKRQPPTAGAYERSQPKGQGALGVNLDQVEGLGPGGRIALENLESPARALRKSSQYGDPPSFSFNLGEKRTFRTPSSHFPL